MSSKDVEALKALGIPEVTAKIYVALIGNPEDLAFEEISTLCKFPLNKTEKALRELVNEGLARVDRNRFIVVPPKQALSAILKGRETEAEKNLGEIRGVIGSLQKSLEPFYLETRAGIRPGEIIEPLEDLAAMELRTVRIIGDANKEVLIFAERFDWYDKISEVLAQAMDRGAKARILMLVADDATLKRAKELEKMGIKVMHCAEKWYPVRGTVVDGKEMVFLIWATKTNIPKPVYFKPHYTTNQGLIKIFLDAYEKRWQEAKTLTKLREM